MIVGNEFKLKQVNKSLEGLISGEGIYYNEIVWVEEIDEEEGEESWIIHCGNKFYCEKIDDYHWNILGNNKKEILKNIESWIKYFNQTKKEVFIDENKKTDKKMKYVIAINYYETAEEFFDLEQGQEIPLIEKEKLGIIDDEMKYPLYQIIIKTNKIYDLVNKLSGVFIGKIKYEDIDFTGCNIPYVKLLEHNI